MLNPFAKLFSQDDSKKSADLAELLEKHLKTKPAADAECKPLYAKATEITIRLNAAKECGDPEAHTLHQEREAVLARIRTKQYVFDHECSRLRNQLEKLTRSANLPWPSGARARDSPQPPLALA
jgi:hypothetical protein